MSKNKIRKTVSFNINNPDDLECLKKVNDPDFNFNSYVRKLILDDIRKEQSKVVQKSTNGGIKIIVG